LPGDIFRFLRVAKKKREERASAACFLGTIRDHNFTRVPTLGSMTLSAKGDANGYWDPERHKKYKP